MRPRIVVLSAFATPFRSGAEACAEEVSKELQDKYDITIVTARLQRDLPREEQWGRVKVVRVGNGSRLDKWLFPYRAAKVVARLKPDLVHAVLESFAGYALVQCKKRNPKMKTLLTCQSTNTSLFLKDIHAAADRVTAISSVLVDRAKLFKKKNVVLIPNGVHVGALERARKTEQKMLGRVLFVGRLEPMKGVDTLLLAWKQVMRVHRKDAHLRIVGDGSLMSPLKNQAKKLGLGSTVTFVGRVPPDRIAKEYAQAPIFCALSRSEALGNVFLESQAAGCAVIATKVGGIPDIVHDGDTGVLIAPNDPDAASAAIIELLEDAQLREHLAKSAAMHAREFDWGAIAKQYAEVYQQMLK